MAAIALVLLTTEPGREQDVVKELSRMSEIEEAMVLFGEYAVSYTPLPLPTTPYV